MIPLFALTASRNVDRFVDTQLRTFRIKGSTKIFRGSFVGLTSAGFARALVAGDPFCGLAYEEVDNSTGADGAKVCRVYADMSDFEHALAGVSQSDVGRPCFASADDTLSFVGVANSYIGVVQDYVSANKCIVRIDPLRRLVKTIVHAVENLSANADIAARAIHCFEMEGWIIAARVVNQATSPAGIDASNTCVVALANTAGAVATETFDATPAFPAANTKASLGAITNPHCPAGDVVTLTVTTGTTADPGPFLVEVDYV
ncbi:MAG: hypothetical protein AABZ47_03275 [Planctomycetota bacterium]